LDKYKDSFSTLSKAVPTILQRLEEEEGRVVEPTMFDIATEALKQFGPLATILKNVIMHGRDSRELKLGKKHKHSKNIHFETTGQRMLSVRDDKRW
jgi:hypothetical protein